MKATYSSYINFFPLRKVAKYRDRLKSAQGQAEQVSKSKSKNKLLPTTYKPFSRSLYIFHRFRA